jgi:hypothetical protein
MGKKKTKTSSTETSHSVTTPNNPEWVTSGAQSLGAGIQRLGGMDPTSFVAPLSDLEKQAAQGASGLSANRGGAADQAGSDAWFSKLMSTPAPAASSASLLDNLSAYYNPYRDQVTNAATADFDAEAGRTRAAQDLALAGQGAFGGSGAALTKSLTEGELARARNTQVSKLLSDMFTTSAGLSSQDADRRQQASLANAQLAQQNNQFQAQYALDRDANDRANYAGQAALGQQLRGVDQATRLAPVTALGQQVDMFSGLPLSLFQGTTTDSNGTRNSTETTSGGTFGELAGGLASLASFSNPFTAAMALAAKAIPK